MSNQQLTEASLSRVWQHLTSDRPVALLTAFRGEFDREQNVQRNKTLAAQIKQAGYGYFFVDGYWVENEGTENEVHVAEDSIFAIGSADKETEFKQLAIQLGKKYNQDAVLIKDSTGVKLYDQVGNSFLDLGEFKPGKLAQAYTRLRNNKDSNTFVFEAERDDLGWLQKLAGINKGE